jgi:pimeloyl-ACP methyl ester carboxylesterase
MQTPDLRLRQQADERHRLAQPRGRVVAPQHCREKRAGVAAPDDAGLIWLPDEAFAAAFAQHASAEDRAVLSAVQRPISLDCITVPWRDIPSWFLVADDDRMIVPETQRYMAERMKAKIKMHDVDHMPSVTSPESVVDIIRDAMRFVAGT